MASEVAAPPVPTALVVLQGVTLERERLLPVTLLLGHDAALESLLPNHEEGAHGESKDRNDERGYREHRVLFVLRVVHELDEGAIRHDVVVAHRQLVEGGEFVTFEREADRVRIRPEGEAERERH